jgi:PAS domain S-box-containing protein
MKMGGNAKRPEKENFRNILRQKSKQELIDHLLEVMAKGQSFPEKTAKKTSRRAMVKETSGLSREENTLRGRIDRILLTKADDEMYSDVLHALLEAMESDYGVFGYIDENGTFVAPSLTRDAWDKCRMPEKRLVFPREIWREEALWGRALLQKKSLLMNQPGKVPEGHLPIHRALMVPILYRGELIGIFQFANKKSDYTEEDIQKIENIAKYVSPVLHARLQRNFEERRRKQAELKVRRRTSKLQQLTETLEWRVKERTAELEKANELLKSEFTERLRLVAAVEQAIEGIVILDSEGLIHYVNPAFERMNRSHSDVLGKDYGKILAGDKKDHRLEKEIINAVRKGKGWEGRIIRKRKDLPSLDLDVSFSPIYDHSGTIINYLAVERDVTHEVRLQQHIRQTRKMEALGTLAGGIAHDFNNILNPIFINTEQALMDLPENSTMYQSLQSVMEAAERGKDLVKQIVTFSRQKEQERKPLKLEPLVKETLKFLRASLPKTVDIQENIQKETGSILANPTQIHQVIMNLCSNAAYAMRQSGGILEVGLTEVEVDTEMANRHPGLTPGPYQRLTVTDTGEGMTRDVIERAFDPFFTTKKPGEGTGMGLSVVHGIVDLYDGSISCYSELGKGTTFNVFLPRAEGDESSQEDFSMPLATGKERILLVDDEKPQVESIQSVLDRLGYRVVATTDSLKALEIFRKNPRAFDLVITDQTMPGMTGIKLAEELLLIRPDVPIVLCTGFSETVDADRADALGIHQFLMKPFSIGEISGTLRRALRKK